MAIWCKVVLKAKAWCQTSTIKEVVLDHKEVVNAVAEVDQEEVTEVATWVLAVINSSMLKDHHNNQVHSHNNNITMLNSNNNKYHNNNLEWPHVDLTQLWVWLNNHKYNQSHYCLFQKLIWPNSSKSPIPMKRNNSLVTVYIQISNKLSDPSLLVKLQVCWLMRTPLISTYSLPINNTSLIKPEKPWVFSAKHKCNNL